jgi:hypothetical protein
METYFTTATVFNNVLNIGLNCILSALPIIIIIIIIIHYVQTYTQVKL